MPTIEQIREALEVVIDPELHRSIVELDMVRANRGSSRRRGRRDRSPDDRRDARSAGTSRDSVRDAVMALEGVRTANVDFDVLDDAAEGGAAADARPRRAAGGRARAGANVVCVGSGKGGVGKSTLTANLAAALAAEGKRVGVLDADVWGYSIPRMFGLGAERPPVSPERKIIPLESHGVKVMSIGFFVEEDAAVVWRGPMLTRRSSSSSRTSSGARWTSS